ncbi:MAG: hypothetical protein KatS3mg081_0988 [Gemmatimonadales bacterium]|nr:MAG: hypothetical protein KatS3mg081_0988 [Gemmatimonadales bacterium]
MTTRQSPGIKFRTPARGFTLVELLVVLLILSILLAVVIPVVTQQSDAADAPRVASDLTGIRDGIALFRTNVREFPGDLEDLANLIIAGTDKTLLNTDYNAADVNRWKGPYIEATVPAATTFQGSAFGTALDAAVLNGLECFNANGDTVAIAPANCADSVAAGKTIFVAVRLTGIEDTLDFLRINELIDGSTETAPRSQGRLRHGNFIPDTVFYLAVPIARK